MQIHDDITINLVYYNLCFDGLIVQNLGCFLFKKDFDFFIDVGKKLLGRMLLLSTGAKWNYPFNSIWPYIF